MDRDDFSTVLDMYGADLALWPDDQAAAARSLLARDGHAQRLFEQAKALDAALSEALSPASITPSADFMAALAARAAAEPQGENPASRPADNWLQRLLASNFLARGFLARGFLAGLDLRPAQLSGAVASLLLCAMLGAAFGSSSLGGQLLQPGTDLTAEMVMFDDPLLMGGDDFLEWE